MRLKPFGTRRMRTARITVPVVVVAAAALSVAFLNAGAWLTVTDPLPARVDVVFTFAGENARFAYSRRILERYRNAHWVLSDYFHQYSRILTRENYDMSRISFVDTCQNTISEVRGLVDWIRETKTAGAAPGASSDAIAGPDPAARGEPLRVALVSNPFHMRRIKYMVENVARGDTTLEFHYCPVPLDRYHWTIRDVRRWWRSETMRNWIASEIAKLVAFWFFS